MNIPLLKQMFVVVATQLVAISTGGAMSIPSVLLQQFKMNDSEIQVDVHTESWIASVHGFSGVSSLVIPYVMQCWGRKFGFRLTCLFMLIGWIMLCFANSSNIVIIAELFQGVGTKCLLLVITLTLSEMVEPKIRNRCILIYGVIHTIVVLCVHTAGRFIHWKTISFVMCFPLALSILFSFIWPESPAWLAYKGRFEESKKSFMWFRGENEESLEEMKTLFKAQREFLNEEMIKEKSKRNKPTMRTIWHKISKREFYLPIFHMFVLLSCYYWSGLVVIMVYAINLIEKVIDNTNTAFIGMIVIDIAMIIGNISCITLLKYFDNKPILLTSGGFAIIFLICSSIVSYLQEVSIVSNDSTLCLYFLAGFMVCASTGFYIIPFAVSGEIMPLRHRGVGSSLHVMFLCVSYTASVKVAPYLIMYLGVYGTFLVYAIILIVCLLWVWLSVPETRHKTLQSIEEYYIISPKYTNESLEEETNETSNLSNQ